MNSSQFNKMFDSTSKLSREDITAYGNTTDERVKHSIELNASNPFESDAMDGWEELSYDISKMNSLDKKLTPTTPIKSFIIGGALVALVGVVLFVLAPSNKTNNPKTEKVELTEPKPIKNQDLSNNTEGINTPELIELMSLAPKEKQIEIQTIQNNFQEQKVIKAPEKLKILPFNRIENKSQPSLNRSHKRAKEIYIFNLKLVDYKKYRSSSRIKPNTPVLTGTPANKEQEAMKNTEEPEIRIEIPYTTYINKALEVFSLEQYKLALKKFESVLLTYPDDANANFYAGLCLFNLSEYNKAIDAFRNCILGPFSNFDEESQWMIALSLQELGEEQQAVVQFKTIIQQGGFYKKQAVEKLK